MSATAPRRWAALLVATVAVHALLWWAIGRQRGIPLEGILQHFDSAWYSLMVGEGYAADAQCWVFYPLYPLAVRGLVAVSGLWSWQATVGALFSTACLALACRIAEGVRARDGGEHAGLLYPQSSWGHAVLLLSPAAFALHSHHTEGMFLALSLGAFALASRDRPRLAAVVAGLSSLTRAQGVLVAMCVGLWAARRRRGAAGALLALATSAAISGSIYSLWPYYQWRMTGDPAKSVEMQRYWGYIVPHDVVLRHLMLQGEDQRVDPPTLARYAAMLAALATAALVARRNWILGLYVGLSILATLLRGDPTYSAFRYLCVQFPVLYAWGDAIDRRSRPWRVTAGVILVAGNLYLAANYARGIDAY